MSSARRKDESGFALLFVFLMAAIIAIMLYAAAPRVVFEAQREKEELLIDRGGQYTRAIKVYFRAFRHYPLSLDQLENTNNKRFLRKRYKDPMTGSDEWRLIHMGPAGFPTDSLTIKPPSPKKEGDKTAGAGTGTAGTSQTQQQPEAAALSSTGQPVMNYAQRRGASDRGPLGNFPGQPDGQGDQPRPDENQAPSQEEPGDQQAAAPAPPEGAPSPDQQPGAAQPGQPVQPGMVMQPGQPGQPGMVMQPGQPGQPGMVMQPGQAAQPGSPGQPGFQAGVGVQGGMVQPGVQNQQQPFSQQRVPGLPGQFGPQTGFTGVGVSNPSQPDSPSTNAGLQAIQNQLQRPTGFTQAAASFPGSQTMGAGICGVATKLEGEGIKLYNKRSKYNEWEFIYDPRKDATSPFGQMNMGPNVPVAPVQPGTSK